MESIDIITGMSILEIGRTINRTGMGSIHLKMTPYMREILKMEFSMVKAS